VSDASVRNALRSHSRLVVVEAPGGCGKTHQAAEYANDVASSSIARLLVLTHTHAACSVFTNRTRHVGARVEVRTIDSLIAQIAGAYHAGLRLPADVADWVRREGRDGHARLASNVAKLVERHPMIAASLAQRYPIVICDEHQDCSGDQHAICMAIAEQGARLRIFGDPMQRIFKDGRPSDATPLDWNQLSRQADEVEELDHPHRWNSGCPDLGRWSLQAREALRAGGKVDLRVARPSSVSVVRADNSAPRYGDYRVAGADRRPIDAFERSHDSLMILTRVPDVAKNLRAFFDRRIPLWEGHVRRALDDLVQTILVAGPDPKQLAIGVVTFMNAIGRGFTTSGFGKRLIREVAEGCVRRVSGKPAALQSIARLILDSPDHVGVAAALRQLNELRRTSSQFAQIRIDCQVELREAMRLGRSEDLDQAVAAITHDRTYSRPKPPRKSISTIYKAKGLESDAVMVVHCDAQTFPDKAEARCLLYVALSRAKKALLLVVPNADPSPLLIV